MYAVNLLVPSTSILLSNIIHLIVRNSCLKNQLINSSIITVVFTLFFFVITCYHYEIFEREFNYLTFIVLPMFLCIITLLANFLQYFLINLPKLINKKMQNESAQYSVAK